MIALLWAGCAVPLMLSSHHPDAILAAPVSPDAPPEPAFAGSAFVLRFDGDLSVTPVGAMLDDPRAAVTATQQTFVLPEPGLVLFEALATELEREQATVYRSYGPVSAVPSGAVVLGVRVDAIEFHHWRTSDGEFHLVGAAVTWQLGAEGTPADAPAQSDVVRAKVPPTRDAFAAAAVELAASLRRRLP